MTTTTLRTLAVVMGASLGLAPRLAAQAPTDSIAVWVSRLGSSDAVEKTHGYSSLAALSVDDVPADARLAIVDELTRLHRSIVDGSFVNPDTGDGEGFGEAYLSLTMLAARFDTDDSRRALIGAVGAGPGAQRRVARLGDAALPDLTEMLDRDTSPTGVYHTFGYAWFWTDSTGTGLSNGGRATVLQRLMEGLGATTSSQRFGAGTSLGAYGDPALLFDLSCLLTPRSFCSPASNLLQQAGQALQAGDVASAERLLAQVEALMVRERDEGALTDLELALLAGSATQVASLGLGFDRLVAGSDTYLKRGTPNKNQGTEEILRIRSSGNNRALIAVDDAELSGISRSVQEARLEFDVVFNANNWGTDGRTIDAHRMLVPWTHLGATWNCAADADPSDGGADCDASAWEMGSLDPSPFDPEASGTILVTGDLMGTLSIDVTDDVVAMIAGGVANHGWILKKTNEGQPGHIQIASSETGSGPRLVVRTGG